MLSVVRVKMKEGNDTLWDYVLENKGEIEKEYGERAKLMYITKRAKHEDTSLFISADDPEALGEFVVNKISTIQGVDGVWMFTPVGMRFYKIPEKLVTERPRFIVKIKAYPAKFSEIYDKISKLGSTSDAAPTYLTYTFHLFGDSIQFSLIAKDEASAKKFAEDNIRDLPGVTGYTITQIDKQVRLTSRDDWRDHVRSNLLPTE